MKSFKAFLHEAVVYLTANDPAARDLIGKTFPDFKGNNIRLQIVPEMNEFTSLFSMWDGGSKDEYKLINLQTNEVMSPPVKDGYVAPFKLPTGFALIERSYFMGKQSVTIWITKENAAPLLGPTEDLTNDEKKVLVATRSLKSSYAGQSNYRQKESGLDPETWERTKQELIGKGLLNRSGAITVAGKNAVSGIMSLSSIR